MRVFAFCGVFLAAAGPALAAPAFLPQRDVAVTYAVGAPGQQAQNYVMDFDAADRLARIESPAQGIYVLANLSAGRAEVVVPALHAVVDAPDFSALTGMIGSADGARFTPLGHGFYAGLGCEKFLVINTQGSGTACITHDGVVLHFSGKDAHGSADVTALNVVFAPQPAGAFAPPDGFTPVTLPPGALQALLQGQ
jgi:hypothetical protein